MIQLTYQRPHILVFHILKNTTWIQSISPSVPPVAPNSTIKTFLHLNAAKSAMYVNMFQIRKARQYLNAMLRAVGSIGSSRDDSSARTVLDFAARDQSNACE